MEAARETASGGEPDINVGRQCFEPYACPFLDYCWPSESEYPVRHLGGSVSKEKLAAFVVAGISDVRDIPAAELTETQQRIQRITKSGRAEL